MDKEEAVQAMREGKKVTHHYFSDEEWMTLKGTVLVFEDGVKYNLPDFWKDRQGIGFEDGFSLFEEKRLT